MRNLLAFALVLGTSHAVAEPLFPNSVVSNDLEFITTSDPHVFRCIAYSGTDRMEMPDKRGGPLMADGVHVFEARFGDGTNVGVWVHPRVGNRAQAEALAKKIGPALGRQPTVMRKKLSHVVIHRGDETAFAEDQGRFFVMYDRNIDRRLSTNDLEETIFHESVHATLDVPHASSRAWRQAQRKDGDFVTRYARDNPNQEDMAESALFAWALLRHPGRLPADVEARVRKVMPARLAVLNELLVKSGPVFQRVAPTKDCG